MNTYNIYCDESCHLEHDGINAMALGAIWCPENKVYEISDRIKQIKLRNGVKTMSEIKWTKVGPAKQQLYEDLVNYFFDESDMHFRGIVIPDKSLLDHDKFNQTHDEWYYKMYFNMLKSILSPKDHYNIYIDIKDTHSYEKSRKLYSVCCNSVFDFSKNIIKKLQPIRSNEVQIIQITDILIGALTYKHRKFNSDFKKSAVKMDLINLIQNRSGYSLTKTTLTKEDKFNLLIWNAR